MAAYVLSQAKARADHPALAVLGAQGLTLTYAGLERAVRATAQRLLDHGLQPGQDRVLMRLGNTPDFPICYLACIYAGLIPIPTSSQLTAPEVALIATQTRPALVMHGAEITLPDPDIPRMLVADLHRADGPLAAPQLGDPNRPAYIIYTSGTSGQPRAVVHAHRAILARKMMWDGWYGLRASDRLLHAGAFNWTYTLGTGLMDPWSIGATALIPAPGTDPTTLPGLLAAHDATIFAAAPGVYRRMLRAQMPAMPRLRHGLSAGEKLPDTIRAAWQAQTGTPIHEAYGMSECSTFISGAPDHPAPAGTLGYPQPGRHVQLMPDTHVIACTKTTPV